MDLRKGVLFGKPILVLEGRIPHEDRNNVLHYYELRHSDDDWSRPATLEKSVIVDFFGTLISKEAIEVGDYIDLYEDGVFGELEDTDLKTAEDVAWFFKDVEIITENCWYLPGR